MNTLLPIADRLIARRNFRFPQQGGTHAPGGSFSLRPSDPQPTNVLTCRNVRFRQQRRAVLSFCLWPTADPHCWVDDRFQQPAFHQLERFGLF
jgi:hypothetical protein